MPAGWIQRRFKSQSAPPTVLEVSVALAVALLLVLTALRLLSGFDVDVQRGAQASVPVGNPEVAGGPARPTRPAH
jgi:hypothetical protein